MRPTQPRVAVAAPDSLAAQAAVDVAGAGGTAVDAAIAAMCVTYVTSPGIVSALGGAFVNVWPADGDPVVIDGNVEMPGRGLPPERFGHGVRRIRLDYGGGITIHAGAGSAATPGAFAAFADAMRAHGRAPVADVLAPAIDAARGGFPVAAAAANYLRATSGTLYSFDPQTAAQHQIDGAPPAAGARMVNPDLARSLEVLAAQGFSSAYTGDLAHRLAAQMEQEGGLITLADLAAYRARRRPATRARLRGWDVALNPPPSIGGPVLTAMLRLMSDDTPDVANLLRIQHRVLRYRAAELDTAPDLTTAGRELLEALERNELRSLPTSSDTAHVSVVDADGTACAITSSAGYSSGVTVRDTGLVLNNCLGEPELNRLGLHALAPGTRLASNMAPTTARHADAGVLAIGTPGADRITTALMQVLARYALAGMGLQEAIDAPRAHVWFDGDEPVVAFEPDPATVEAVDRLGWRGVPHEPLAMYFGGVGAAARTAGGAFTAAGDPRRTAATAIG